MDINKFSLEQEQKKHENIWKRIDQLSNKSFQLTLFLSAIITLTTSEFINKFDCFRDLMSIYHFLYILLLLIFLILLLFSFNIYSTFFKNSFAIAGLEERLLSKVLDNDLQYDLLQTRYLKSYMASNKLNLSMIRSKFRQLFIIYLLSVITLVLISLDYIIMLFKNLI